jgi:PAS domain S-box-containing protein
MMNKSALAPAPVKILDDSSARPESSSAGIEGCDHSVQFYESDSFLADRVSDFLKAGIDVGESAILVGTPEHRVAIEKRLSQQGVNLLALVAAGQYFPLDAQETLSKLMAGDSPDEKRFNRVIGGVVTKASNGGRCGVRAFGEMVALLWADGKCEQAIQLEELWNGLSRTHSFSLLCAYPMEGFSGTPHHEAFTHICRAHSSVLPTESYTASSRTEEDRLRANALLEQKAISLEAEIVQRKQVEDRGRLLSAIVEHSDDAIISKDLNGTITSWNNGAERIFGYTADEIVGRSVITLIPPELQYEEPGILAKLRKGERIDHYETTRRRKDGIDVEVSLTVSPLKDETGKIIGASKIARDITEKKRAQRIQQALYDLTSAVNRSVALPDIYDAALTAVCRCQYAQRVAILLYDADGTMRFKAWRNLSDEYRHAVEGHSPWQRDDPSPQPVCIDNVIHAPLEDHLHAVINREGIQSLAFLPITYENRLLGKFMVYYDAPHHFTAEELQPAQTIVSQVAFAIERRRTGETLERMVNERTASLREAIAQMEEFSYSVSHDLRAPVRAMQCYAEVLMEDYGAQLDEHAKKYLDRIIRGGTRMDRLIQDILTYSRLSRREIQLHPISLDKLTREIVRQYLDLSSAANPDISVEGQLSTVIGHEPSLSQAISNLLNNAVKFVAPGATPKVHVRTERRNGDVRLWIEDNGIGIKPEYQHRLFSVFERVHPEKNYEGTGIGLAIVRKAAERMGGKAGVESDGVNGSKFWIQLPAAENPSL